MGSVLDSHLGARWLQFAKERFDPISHGVLIALFTFTHAIVSVQENSSLDGLRVAWAFLFSLCFFFKLRLYDEIKDFDTDRKFNPHRPLARGLLQVSDVTRAIVVIIAVELLLLLAMGLETFAIGSGAILYSLLMYKEFFIGSWLRPKLTTYALSHTIVCSILSATLLTALSGKTLAEWPLEFWAFAAGNWLLFNVFEFGRKTFASNEERDLVPSYSKIFGRPGAVILVLIQVLAATILFSITFKEDPVAQSVFILSGLALFISGSAYVVKDNKRWASLFRFASSFYIVLVFAGAMLLPVLAKIRSWLW